MSCLNLNSAAEQSHGFPAEKESLLCRPEESCDCFDTPYSHVISATFAFPVWKTGPGGSKLDVYGPFKRLSVEVDRKVQWSSENKQLLKSPL